jgi:hypothetical protein
LFVCCDFVGKDFDGAPLAPVESINVLQMESTLIQVEQVLLASKRSLKSGLLCLAAGRMYTSFGMVWSEDAHE